MAPTIRMVQEEIYLGMKDPNRARRMPWPALDCWIMEVERVYLPIVLRFKPEPGER